MRKPASAVRHLTKPRRSGALADWRKADAAIAENHRGWLALIHEVHVDGNTRRYQHRFVWFDAMNVLRSITRRFFFQANGIEYAAGLTWHPDGKRLLISYGVGDSAAWIATVDALEVRQALTDPHNRLGSISEPDPAAPFSHRGRA